jgi:aspartyl-tRNA(Asn)/glutamyl-tRNA(Gln) amidotransferase subunit C
VKKSHQDRDPSIPVIPNDQLEIIIHLAGLGFNPEEIHILREQLQKILRYVRKLDEMDLEDVEPIVHPLQNTGHVRADEPSESMSRAAVLTMAPDHADGYIKVPFILEEEHDV